MAESFSEKVDRAHKLARYFVDMGYGEWDYYGGSRPLQGGIEASPGISIGTAAHTEPIARFSGYLLPVENTAEFSVLTDPHFIHNLISEYKQLKDRIERYG